MSRTTGVVASRNRRKKIVKLASGYRGNHSRLYRNARESVNRARRFSFISRKVKKRDFRSLWILRLNAASRACGLSYSRLISGLKKAGVTLNRKELSEMAIHYPDDFKKVVELAKTQVAS